MESELTKVLLLRGISVSKRYPLVENVLVDEIFREKRDEKYELLVF